MYILLFYLLISVVTYMIYAIDKSAAMQNRWRVPEKTLHLLSLCGGWPGAFIAQQYLRHKTQKASFRLVYWLTVGAHLGFVGWLILRR